MAFEDITKQLRATDERIAYAKELAKKGQLDKAEQILRKNLNAVVELYGSGSLKTCNFLIDLAEVNYDQEKYPEVVTTLQQVLITNNQEQLFSKEEILSVKFKFAKALEHSGNVQDACNAYAELLYDAESIFGPEARFTRTVAEGLNTIARRHKGKLRNVECVEETVSQFDTSKNIIIKSQTNQSDLKKSSDRLRQQSNLQRFKAVDIDKKPSRPINPILSAVAASLLAIGLLISGVVLEGTNPDKKTNPGRATAALDHKKDATKVDPGIYSTTDGLKVLHVDESGSGKLIANNTEKRVSTEKHGAEVYAIAGDKTFVFRQTKHGIIDEEGSTLFKAGVPELDTAASVRTIAQNLNEYWRSYGRYPSSQAQLNSMHDRARFKNPLNDSYSYPRLMSVIERKSSSSMSLSDYSYVNNFTAQLITNSDTMGAPCAVEIYVCPFSDRGETVVIRGYDSNGKLLPSSQNGRCYALVLNQGASHS